VHSQRHQGEASRHRFHGRDHGASRTANRQGSGRGRLRESKAGGQAQPLSGQCAPPHAPSSADRPSGCRAPRRPPPGRTAGRVAYTPIARPEARERDHASFGSECLALCVFECVPRVERATCPSALVTCLPGKLSCRTGAERARSGAPSALPTSRQRADPAHDPQDARRHLAPSATVGQATLPIRWSAGDTSRAFVSTSSRRKRSLRRAARARQPPLASRSTESPPAARPAHGKTNDVSPQ
jgi:hypothetical protein